MYSINCSTADKRKGYKVTELKTFRISSFQNVFDKCDALRDLLPFVQF